MPDVFVSYSRRDAEFVRRLVGALGARGKEAWVDVDGIRDAEVFPAALRAAVEQSDGFVFVISPDSVASPYCEQELEHALELNKRIVPLLLRTVADDAVPEQIRVRNWIPFAHDGEFEPGVARVLDALETDLDWTKAHTRWLLKALEWDSEGRERSFLLRGSELAAAEAWLAAEAGKEPRPTGVQREYVAAGRLAASRRQRTLLGIAAAVTAVSLGLLVFALVSRSQAISARDTARTQALTARSQALAAESQTQLAVDPERSILLAVAAMHERVTPEAMFALRGALDASPIRFRLPDAGPQPCLTAPGVAFSPDGRQIAEGLCSGTVVIADAHTGRVLRRSRVGPAGGFVAYSADGRELAACCRRGIVLLDAATGAVREIGPRPAGGYSAVAFDPAAPVLAVGGSGAVVLWNYVSGKRRTIRYAPPGENPPTISLAFSPNGSRLVGSVPQNAPTQIALVLLDVRNGRLLRTARISATAVAFSPDGTSLAAAELSPRGVGRIELLDPETLALRRILVRAPDVQPTALAYSPDGTRLAYGYADGTAGLLSVRTGARVLTYLGQTAAVEQVAFSPDGRLLATGSSDGTTRVWRASADETAVPGDGTISELHAQAGRLTWLTGAFPLDGARPTVHARQAAGRPLAPLRLSSARSVGAAFMSSDGRLAGVVPASSAPRVPVRIWNVEERRVVDVVASGPSPTGGEPVFGPRDDVIAMSVVPQAVRTASGSGPGGPSGPPTRRTQSSMELLDLRTGRRRVLGGTACGGGWRARAFSANEKLLAAGSFCGQVKIWNVATGTLVGRPFAIGGELAGIAFDPQGTLIAAASWNGTITVADVAGGRIVAQLTGDTSGVTGVAYSPDGRYLASVSLDRSLRIWDARTFRLLRVRVEPDAVYGVTFMPDSRHVVSWDAANTIRIQDACTDCENPHALLALAAKRVTRSLTPQEQRTFGVG